MKRGELLPLYFFIGGMNMAKIYTLDGKLLTERPEIRIGDKIYAVDDRTKHGEKAFRTGF